MKISATINIKIVLSMLILSTCIILSGCGANTGQDAEKAVNKPKPLDINKNYSLLYSGSFKTDSQEIIVSKPDGTGKKLITSNLSIDVRPRVCNKSKVIAFVTNFDKNYEIYISNFLGKNKRNITKNSRHDDNPTFTPDCKKVIFESDRDGNREIYEVGVDGTGLKRLTNNKVRDQGPMAISPDGRFIAFREQVDKPFPHFVNIILDRTTLKTRKLTSLQVEEGPVHWAPNGKYLLFAAMENYNWNLYKILPNGTGITKFNNPDTTSQFEPTISPDSEKIAFIGTQLGKFDVWVTDVNGKKFTRLTDDYNVRARIQFSPDGKFIAYSEKDSNQKYNIFVSALNGNKKFQVTDEVEDDLEPQWIIE